MTLYKLLKYFEDKEWCKLDNVFITKKIIIANDYEIPLSNKIVSICDNLEEIGWKCKIINNENNLGQGPNLAYTISNNLIAEEDEGYLILPGDDDEIEVTNMINFICSTANTGASVGIGGFKQLGKDYVWTTEEKVIRESPEAIDAFLEFGKCSSIILRIPSKDTQDKIEKYFLGCMYEDRAYGCLELMKDTSVYSYPLCVAYTEESIIALRYSRTVFCNLGQIKRMFKRMKKYNKSDTISMRLTIYDMFWIQLQLLKISSITLSLLINGSNKKTIYVSRALSDLDIQRACFWILRIIRNKGKYRWFSPR